MGQYGAYLVQMSGISGHTKYNAAALPSLELSVRSSPSLELCAAKRSFAQHIKALSFASQKPARLYMLRKSPAHHLYAALKSPAHTHLLRNSPPHTHSAAQYYCAHLPLPHSFAAESCAQGPFASQKGPCALLSAAKEWRRGGSHTK